MDELRFAHALCTGRAGYGTALAAYVAAFVPVGAAYLSIQPFNLPRKILTVLVPRIERVAAVSSPAPSAAGLSPPVLSSHEAWEMELFAQPWRNFPLPLATILAAAMSLAFILPLSLAGGYLVIRRTGARPVDKAMLLMVISVLICSYSLQCLLWILRRWIAIYPINFEEMRTVSLIYLPLLYFTLRGFEWLWFSRAILTARRVAVLGVLLLLMQPILIIRLLPRSVRQDLMTFAKQDGILDQRESQRNMNARQVLRLETEKQRFYCSVLSSLAWLKSHSGATDTVLISRDELYILSAKVIGTSNGFLNTEDRSPERLLWHRQFVDLGDALAAHDSARVHQLARDWGARFAVVPWSEPGAVFADGAYSVVPMK